MASSLFQSGLDGARRYSRDGVQRGRGALGAHRNGDSDDCDSMFLTDDEESSKDSSAKAYAHNRHHHHHHNRHHHGNHHRHSNGHYHHHHHKNKVLSTHKSVNHHKGSYAIINEEIDKISQESVFEVEIEEEESVLGEDQSVDAKQFKAFYRTANNFKSNPLKINRLVSPSKQKKSDEIRNKKRTMEKNLSEFFHNGGESSSLLTFSSNNNNNTPANESECNDDDDENSFYQDSYQNIDDNDDQKMTANKKDRRTQMMMQQQRQNHSGAYIEASDNDDSSRDDEGRKKNHKRFAPLSRKELTLVRSFIQDPQAQAILDTNSTPKGDEKEIKLTRQGATKCMQRQRAQIVTSHLSEDTFSFLISSRINAIPFLTAVFIVSLKATLFGLIGYDMSNEGDESNPLSIPAYVTTSVAVSQFFAIFIAVATQGDLITSLDLIFEGYSSDLALAFPGASPMKWGMTVMAYFLEGGLGLIVTFLLIVTSNDGAFVVYLCCDVCSCIHSYVFFRSFESHTPFFSSPPQLLGSF